MKRKRFFLPEWSEQSAVAVTWPKPGGDWDEVYDDIQLYYSALIRAIYPVQKVLVITIDAEYVREKVFSGQPLPDNVLFLETPLNDTWVRDYGAITLLEDDKPVLLDFQFNGWGLKFAANFDNQVNRSLKASALLADNVSFEDHKDFVLEGGAIESDGNGTLLTTTHCLLAPNRNAGWNKDRLTAFLKDTFGMEQILWLEYGLLTGDDTDGHIDTLARFCPGNSIAYVKCDDPEDEQYEGLLRMEEQLREFSNKDGRSYRLFALPMPDAIYDEDRRLPATYANFLIMNKRVLCPVYGQPENDRKAIEVLSLIFPDREVVGIDCRALITQNGSLHCSTMQFPEGVF